MLAEPAYFASMFMPVSCQLTRFYRPGSTRAVHAGLVRHKGALDEQIIENVLIRG